MPNISKYASETCIVRFFKEDHTGSESLDPKTFRHISETRCLRFRRDDMAHNTVYSKAPPVGFGVTTVIRRLNISTVKQNIRSLASSGHIWPPRGL